jgi:hypothetical protein
MNIDIQVIDGRTYTVGGKIYGRSVVDGTTCSASEQVIYSAAAKAALAGMRRDEYSMIRADISQRSGERAVREHRRARRQRIQTSG